MPVVDVKRRTLFGCVNSFYILSRSVTLTRVLHVVKHVKMRDKAFNVVTPAARALKRLSFMCPPQKVNERQRERESPGAIDEMTQEDDCS